ncbi:MAG: SusD/RagB family nutrient-binding outer membrane lipoprotein [Prevotellaceae bacterium]|jgi:hypothetical protein|nr:SusD/RagB family nutrient-binding outer membrane lipoprotein [Prevotellaceae bacterium]
MKKLIYIFAAAALLSFTACTDFEDLNTDPKSTVEVPANALFLAGEKNLADVYTSANLTTSPFRILSQVWTQTSNVGEARYNFTQYNAPGGWWKTIYTKALANLSEAKRLYAEEKTTSEEARKNKGLITDVLEVYAFSLLVNTYGDIPYSEALNRSIPFPKYDDARTIINDLLARLDAAIAGLDVNAASFGAADKIYQGDVAKWKKFSASLKLKLALLLADADATAATQKASEAITAGVFTSNADNAKFPYLSSAVANANPLRQYLVTEEAWSKYFAPAELFIQTLEDLNDPRLSVLFTEAVGGGYAGAGAGEAGAYSGLTEYWTAASAPGVLLDYAEVAFLLAEAAERGVNTGATAEAHYNNAVTASLAALEIDDSDITTYLAQSEVAYTTATGDWRRKIGVQKWLAFANRNWDAWTEIRRLGHPNLNTLSPPAGADESLPLRLYYPPEEQNSNSLHWGEAVHKLPGGNDALSAKLFWQR